MTATFEDIILQSQPAFYRDGADGAGVAGMTWMWLLESPAGFDADWTGVTFECEILDPTTRDPIFELNISADSENRLTIHAAGDDTEELDADGVIEYPWQAFAVKGDDRVCLWAAAPSTFTVYPSGYVEGS